MALLEKSYELAAKYANDGGQNGQMAQVPVAGTVHPKSRKSSPCRQSGKRPYRDCSNP